MRELEWILIPRALSWIESGMDWITGWIAPLGLTRLSWDGWITELVWPRGRIYTVATTTAYEQRATKTDFAWNPRVIPSARCPPKTRMITVGTLRQVRFRGLMHSLFNVKQRSSEFNHSYHILTKHLRNNHDAPRRKIETTSFRSRQHLLCFTE